MTEEIFEKIEESLNEMLNNHEIQSFRFNYDEKKSVLDITIVPVKAVEHVTLNFTVVPTGIEFRDN